LREVNGNRRGWKIYRERVSRDIEEDSELVG
jgi:hypothetical protein